MPSFDRTPDAPQPFGFKILWFAVKAADPASVLGALGIGEVTPANWASGLAAAYAAPQGNEHWVFASPPLGGWVLVVGMGLPSPVAIEADRDIGEKFDLLFSRLMKRFDDVQFFGSHRVSGFVAYARALGGAPVRIFARGDPEVLANFGDQTPEEAKLRLIDLTGLAPEEATNRIFEAAEEQTIAEEKLVASGLSTRDASLKFLETGRNPFIDETDVVELAALWSIDPTRLPGDDHPPGVGLAARLPAELTY